MNYFKETEDVLKCVPTMERSIENLTQRIDFMIEKGTPREPGAVDFTQPFSSANAINDALRDSLELAACIRSREETERMLKQVNDVLAQMEEEEAKVLRMWYIEGLTKAEIAEKIYVATTTTVYHIRNRAVAHFALLYFGAAAL